MYAGIEKDDDSRQSLESHEKTDEIRRFSNKKFDSSYRKSTRSRKSAESEKYSKLSKLGGYQYAPGVLGISYNPFLSTETGETYMNFEVTELLKFWTEKIIEIDTSESEKSRLGLLPEIEPETFCVPISEKRVELRLGAEDNVLITKLGVVWRLLRPSWCPQP